MRKIQHYIPPQTLLVIGALVFISCVNFKPYFNSFYNAEEYFDKAEKIRLESRGDILPQSAINDYKKVIEKSRFVIDTFPEFTMRDKALLLMVQSYYHLGELRNANGILGEVDNEFGDRVHTEVSYWRSMIKWKQGKPQPAINGLIDLIQFDLISDFEAKVYL
mgnify:FL=1